MRRRAPTIVLVVLIAALWMQRRGGPPALLAPAGSVDPRTIPIGMYAGAPALPMTPRVVLVDQLLESLMGPPGLEVAGSTDTATYYGTDVVPAPVYPRQSVNSAEALEVAPIAATSFRGGML